MSARILVLEDDIVLQEVLSSALSSRGYAVDVTDDGVKAVQMLRGGGYDLALMDYRLPELDGVSAARLMRDGKHDGASQVKLIAVTASAVRLEERVAGLSLFDAVVQKPFDLHKLLVLVAAALDDPARRRSQDASHAAWRGLGLPGRPKAVAVPPASREQAAVLDLYFDLDDGRDADLILLTDVSGTASLNLVRTRSDGYLLPIVDLTGRLGDAADAAFGASDLASWTAVASALHGFAERRRKLSPSVALARDVDTRLLAYLFVSGRAYAPTADPNDPSCMRYPGFFTPEFQLAAERLAHRGLLRRRFADRFHACASCDSHRLNVREECPSCRSADLSDVAVMHHFRCAYTGPETEFKLGADLVCPKCRQHLRHYGSDYDKPGHMLVCQACGARNSEPSIGFSCLDCGAHTDGDAARQRDVFAYDLADHAITSLTAREPDLIANPVREEMLRLAQAGGHASAGLAVAQIRYGARDRITKARGERAFEAMRRLFVENMRNALHATESVVTDGDLDYLLVADADPDEQARFLSELLRHAGEVLADDVEPRFEMMDPPLKVLAS
jgi:CheY-like chemotaxis protein